MDQIYLWIIILFAVILILDYSERFMKKSKKENFDNQSDPKKSLPIYYVPLPPFGWPPEGWDDGAKNYPKSFIFNPLLTFDSLP